jgi:hypothetical protein
MEITMIEMENVKEFKWSDSTCGFTYANTNYTDIELNHTNPSYILGPSVDDLDTIIDENADINYSGELF